MRLFYPCTFAVLLLLGFVQVQAQGPDKAGLSSTAASAAYSTRLVRTAYTGFSMRVRRSSDNAEADVAFDAANQAVTHNSVVTVTATGSSALTIGSTLFFASFYAGTDCYVTTWYDQSGNGRDAVQATTASQPRIVSAGVLDLLSGKAALTFQTTSQEMTYTASTFTVQTINAIRSAPDHNWQTLVAVPADNDFSVRGVSTLYNNSPNSNDWYFSTGSPNQFWVSGVQNAAYTGTTVHTITAYAASPQTGSMSISTSFMTRGMYGGAAVSEILLFPASLSTTDRQALETNQSAFIASALPLNLVSFTGNYNNAVDHLQWQTAGETNTSVFIIERKNGNGDFTAIAQVAAKGQGNGIYQYNDAVTTSGNVLYRLKMEDVDGHFTYSGIITLSTDELKSATKAYPNPASSVVTLQINDKQLLHTKAMLLDINGKVLYNFTINNWQSTINIGNQPAGIYVVQLNNGELVKITKK